MIVAVILEQGAVNLVGAALSLDIDGRAPGEALLRVKAVCDDVDFLDGFQARDV